MIESQHQDQQQRSAELERQLERAAARINSAKLQEGALLFTAWGLGLLWLLFIIDVSTHIPYVVRLLFWTSSLGYGIFWFYRQPWRSSRQKIDAETASLWVEKENPELQSRLISTLQFQKVNPDTTKMSMELIRGTMDQAFTQLPNISIDQAFIRKLPKNWVLSALALCCIWGLSLAISPEKVSVFAQRLVIPQVKYPTETQIESVHWPQPFIEKQAFDIVIKSKGLHPSAGTVEIEGQQGEVLKLECLPTEGQEGSYTAQCRGLSGSSTMKVILGDDRWGPTVLNPLTRPQLLSCELRVQAPAYTGKGPSSKASGSARVLMGSKVTWSVLTKGDLEQLSLLGEQIPESLRFEKGEQPNQWFAETVVQESFSYQLQLIDTHGVESLKTPQYRISISKDKAPSLNVIHPNSAIEMASRSKTKIEVDVRDDYGLDSIQLMYHVDSGQKEDFFGEQSKTGTVLKSVPIDGENYRLEGIWDNSEIQCRPGDRVEVWFRASDRSQPVANVTDSKAIQISIIDDQTYRNTIITRLNEEIEPVNQIVTKLKGGQRSLETLSQ